MKIVQKYQFYDKFFAVSEYINTLVLRLEMDEIREHKFI